MTTPILNFGQYTVCFNSAPERDINMRTHFIKECGWTASQYARIKNFAWFCAEVSIWKNGEELAIEYLGACCYKTAKEFHTVYAGDYFSDMVHTCAQEIDDAELMALVNTWRDALRPAQGVAA